MSSSIDINVRDILKRCLYLENLKLTKISSTFKGEPISMHENIKHMKINAIEQNFLIEMIRMMPNLESLQIIRTQFPFNKIFLQNMHAAVTDSLKKLKLKFNSQRSQDFAVENLAILEDIIKKLHSFRVLLTGNYNFSTLSGKISSSGYILESSYLLLWKHT